MRVCDPITVPVKFRLVSVLQPVAVHVTVIEAQVPGVNRPHLKVGGTKRQIGIPVAVNVQLEHRVVSEPVTVDENDVLTVFDGVHVPVMDCVAVVEDEAPKLTVAVDVGDCVGDSEVDADCEGV